MSSNCIRNLIYAYCCCFKTTQNIFKQTSGFKWQLCYLTDTYTWHFTKSPSGQKTDMLEGGSAFIKSSCKHLTHTFKTKALSSERFSGRFKNIPLVQNSNCIESSTKFCRCFIPTNQCLKCNWKTLIFPTNSQQHFTSTSMNVRVFTSYSMWIMDTHSSDTNDNCIQNIKVKGYRTRKDFIT